jgi:hypothetical protein
MVGNDVVDLAAAPPHACEKPLRGLGAATAPEGVA